MLPRLHQLGGAREHRQDFVQGLQARARGCQFAFGVRQLGVRGEIALRRVLVAAIDRRQRPVAQRAADAFESGLGLDVAVALRQRGAVQRDRAVLRIEQRTLLFRRAGALEQRGDLLAGRRRRPHADRVGERGADLGGRRFLDRLAARLRCALLHGGPGRRCTLPDHARRGHRLRRRLQVEPARKEAVCERERQQNNAGGAAEGVLLAREFATGHGGSIIRAPRRQ